MQQQSNEQAKYVSDELAKIREELVSVEDNTSKQIAEYVQLHNSLQSMEKASNLTMGRVNRLFLEVFNRMSEAKPSDILKVAASQLQLISLYHNLVLEQAKKSFFWALVWGGVGVLFFIFAVAFSLQRQPDSAAVIGTIGGVTAQLIAGYFLHLYKSTSQQLSEFHRRLDAMQRYLVANSIITSIGEETKDSVRSELVRTIAGIEIAQTTRKPESDGN
jgi:hypothetical protein